MGKLLSWNPDAYINWRLRNRGQRATFCLSILLPSPIKPLLCNMPTVDGEKRNQNEIIVSVKSKTRNRTCEPRSVNRETARIYRTCRAGWRLWRSPTTHHILGSKWRRSNYTHRHLHRFPGTGLHIFFSLIAVVVINLNFSLPTRLAHSWIPDPLFRVYVDSIHKSKHGSDSGVIDAEGRFVPQNFENLFSKYDKTGTGSLSLRELFDMMHGHRCAVDPFGWGAAIFEWGTTWLLIQKDGRVYREDIRQLYDGSLFCRIKAERKKGQGWKQGFGLGGDWFFGAQKMNPGPLS